MALAVLVANMGLGGRVTSMRAYMGGAHCVQEGCLVSVVFGDHDGGTLHWLSKLVLFPECHKHRVRISWPCC